MNFISNLQNEQANKSQMQNFQLVNEQIWIDFIMHVKKRKQLNLNSYLTNYFSSLIFPSYSL